MTDNEREEIQYQIDREESGSMDWINLIVWIGLGIISVLFWGAVAGVLMWVKYHAG